MIFLMLTICYVNRRGPTHLCFPWSLSLDSEGVVVKNIVNCDVLLYVPGHQLQQEVVNVQAWCAELLVKSCHENIPRWRGVYFSIHLPP